MYQNTNMITGEYAITSNPLPWFKQKKSIKSKKIKKTVVVYPLFLQCSEVVTDPFWKNFFVKMSTNKLPKGFRVKSNRFVCHDRNKTQYVILTGEIIEIASKCMQFLREVANIMSQYDRAELRKTQIDAMKKANIPKTWNDIKKKKSEKRAAIIQFASELSEKYNLNTEESKKFLTLLNLSYFVGKLISDDIIYSQGRIIKINGLIRTDNEFKLDEEHDKRKYKFREKELRSDNIKHEYTCKLSEIWAKIVAKKCGLTKAKVLKAITTARSNTLSTY